MGKVGRWARGHIENGMLDHHEVEDYQQYEVAKTSLHDDGSTHIDGEQAHPEN